MIKDNVREKYNEEKFDIVGSIGLINILNMHNILPIEFVESGRFKRCIYFKDRDYMDIKERWDNGEYNEYKLYNKSYGLVKKALATGNLDCMRMI